VDNIVGIRQVIVFLIDVRFTGTTILPSSVVTVQLASATPWKIVLTTFPIPAPVIVRGTAGFFVLIKI